MSVNGRRQNGGGRHNFVGRPKPLLVYTGLLGDTDRPARHRDSHRGLYLYALAWQDGWTVDQHRSFWTGCLDLCPRGEPGKRRHRDDLAAVAGWLRMMGVVDESIINMLREATGPNGPNADTLRKYETLDALSGEPAA